MLRTVLFTCESLVAHFEINEHPTKKTATRFCLLDSYSLAVDSFSLLSFAGSMTHHKSFNNPLESNTLVGRTQIAEPGKNWNCWTRWWTIDANLESQVTLFNPINFFKPVVFPNKWKLQNPSLPLFPPCQASSCDPSSPSDGSPCACSQGPWPLPFSCSSPGTREETCNDSRQIQKRFQKEKHFLWNCKTWECAKCDYIFTKAGG